MSNNLKQQIKQLQNFVNLFDISNIGLWEMTAEGTVQFYNKKFYQQFDIQLVDSSLDEWLTIVHPEDKHVLLNNVSEQINEHMATFKSEYRVINENNEELIIQATGLAEFDQEGQLVIMTGIHNEITSEKKYENRLYELAFVDEHTSLYNKRKLIEDIEDDLKNETPGKLVFWDFCLLDQLIAAHGFEYTNVIINEAIKLYYKVWTEEATLYRISTSKFATKLKASTNESIIKNINLIKYHSKSFKDSLNFIPGIEINNIIIDYPGIGISNAGSIIDKVYLSLELAKAENNNQIIIFDDMIESKIKKQMFIENCMLESLGNREFHMVYQPILNMSQEIVGFESLIRWHSHEYGVIYPDTFIPVSEKNYNIINLGKFALRESLLFLKDYPDRTSISVNASIVELMQTDYPAYVLSLLEELEIKAEQLTIEITETMLIEDLDQVLRQIKTLSDAGIQIALDDFGVGYASLNNMMKLPLNKVKIDREIIKELGDDKTLLSFIKSVILLCHNNDIKVVAEGIEDQDLHQLCASIDFDYYQGYHYSKPVSRDTALNM